MLSRKNTAERTAAQAWDYLSSAMAGAGESAKDAGKHTADLASAKAAVATATAAKLGKQSGKLAGKASKQSGKLADRATAKLNQVSDEALERATLAANALAGRKPGVPWGLIAGAGLFGIALGWVAAATARAAVERQAENEQLELAEADPGAVVTPTYGS